MTKLERRFTFRDLFLGDDGKLRPILRAWLFFLLGTYGMQFGFDRLFGWLFARLNVPPDFSAQGIFLGELELLIVAGLLTALFAWYEGHRADSYGLPLKQAFGGLFWEGAALGFVWPALVAAGMLALGGMQIHGLALSGATLVVAALWWAVANVTIGLAEELWYRGYLLQTLWKSLGFWPAAAVLSLFFASDHFFFKTGENIYDVISLIGFNLLVCYTVLKTGSLWFGVGMHAAFAFTQLFLIGTKNGDQVPVHRLLDVSFNGPAWLTGGVLGTEASVLMYPLLALAFAYVWWRFRRNPASQDGLAERS